MTTFLHRDLQERMRAIGSFIGSLEQKSKSTVNYVQDTYHETRVYVDTGAGFGLISPHGVDMMGLVKKPYKEGCGLKDANGRPISTTDVVEVAVLFDNLGVVTHPSLVAPMFKDGLILGTDFMDSHGAELSYRTHKLVLSDLFPGANPFRHRTEA